MVIKAAGNMAYPMGCGLRGGRDIHALKTVRSPFETIRRGLRQKDHAWHGAEKGVPVLVTIPQMVGEAMLAGRTSCRGAFVTIADMLERPMS